jgi:hypothetical protein
MTSRRILLLLPALLAALAGAPKSASAQADPSVEPPPPPPDEDFDQSAPPPPSAQPPAAVPDQHTFDQQLSPYGRWVDTPEYGRVWIPNVGPDWQPYADGQWVSTTWGWSFAAPVPWGWAVYHYGRWGWRGGFGWFWVPGYVWAPAWVSWRWTAGYACWSPIGPVGYHYPHRWPGWVVVPHAHFAQPIHSWAVPRARIGVIVRSARPVRAFPTWHASAPHAFRANRGGGHRR